MEKFLKRILLFSIPLILFALFLLLIDPFGLFNLFNPSEEFKHLKLKISKLEHQALIKIIGFKQNPADLIILGDSRGGSLGSVKFNELTGLSSYNLSIEGGSLREAIDLFWFAISEHKVKEVYFAINFNLYDKDYNFNRVTEAQNLLDTPIKLLLSRYSIRASAKVMLNLLFGTQINSNPIQSKEEFWEYQLNSVATGFYMNYTYPDNYYQSLSEIADYCKNNGIKLVFVIPPTHIDLQKRIFDFNLVQENHKFILDLSSLGTVYNFDIESSLTNNCNNFNDPFHTTSEIANIVVEELILENNPNYFSKHSIY